MAVRGFSCRRWLSGSIGTDDVVPNEALRHDGRTYCAAEIRRQRKKRPLQAPLESPAAIIITGIRPMMNRELVVAGTRSMAPLEQRSIAAGGRTAHLNSNNFAFLYREDVRRTAPIVCRLVDSWVVIILRACHNTGITILTFEQGFPLRERFQHDPANRSD
jgi:hypothetical protein